MNSFSFEYDIKKPSSYNQNTKVILMFHGYGSNANEQMNYGDLRSQADANGFILVHPDALDDIGGKSYWNMGGWSRLLYSITCFGTIKCKRYSRNVCKRNGW